MSIFELRHAFQYNYEDDFLVCCHCECPGEMWREHTCTSSHMASTASTVCSFLCHPLSSSAKEAAAALSMTTFSFVCMQKRRDIHCSLVTHIHIEFISATRVSHWHVACMLYMYLVVIEGISDLPKIWEELQALHTPLLPACGQRGAASQYWCTTDCSYAPTSHWCGAWLTRRCFTSKIGQPQVLSGIIRHNDSTSTENLEQIMLYQ